LKILEEFDQKLLRLKIVQGIKKEAQKNDPDTQQNESSTNNTGLGFDADTMSMSGTSSYSDSSKGSSALS
jgi:hypothetical protein